MKINNICPKCNSNEIIRFNGYAGPYGVGNNIIVGKTIFSAVNVDRYICCSCGYSEEWIDPADIDSLMKSNKATKITGDKY